jgi:cobalt-zinc-cadmium efflux system outer membrane protein
MVRSLASAVFIAAVLYAGSACSITLDEAVTTAVSQNPELSVLRMDEELAKGQIEKAQLPLIANPVIEGSGSRKERLPEEGPGKVTNYGVRLSQEFEVAGQRALRIEVAEKNFARISLEIRDRERGLAYAVRNAFVRALASKTRLSLASDVSRLQEELLEFTRVKFQGGEVSALEVNLAEVTFSKARKDVVSAMREYRESLVALQALMGTVSEKPLTVEGEITPEIASLPAKEVLRSRLFERPDLRAASVETERTQKAADLVAREAVPNITLGGFRSRDEQRNETGATFAVSIPLFDRKQGEKREAKARATQARIRKAGIEKSIEREFEVDYSSVASTQEELSIFKREIVAKSLENLELLNLAFREGKISFFDIRLAQRETIEVQFAYLDSLLRAQESIHKLERTIGGTIK